MACDDDEIEVVVETGTPDVPCPNNPETFKPLVSTFVNEQLPEYIRQNFQPFVRYLEAFYEFLELPANPIGRIVCYPDYTDVDWTTDEFFYLFKQTFLSPLPENLAADRAIVTKRIKDLYAAKGTEKSIRLLFRILYGEEISVFLPKELILRASDGDWREDSRIYATPISGTIFEFERNSVTGQSSGAKAEIVLVDETIQGSLTVYEMVVQNVVGTFEEGEIIISDQCHELQAQLYGVIASVDIIDGGDGYKVGDVVTFDHPQGVNAQARVKRVGATNPVDGFIIQDGGDGYRVGDPIDFSPNADGGVGAVGQVSLINVTSTTLQDVKIIASEQLTILDTIDHIVIEDFLDFQNIERGEITEIEVLEGGAFYPTDPFAVEVGTQLPAPCVTWAAGVGADILATTANAGVILEVEVTNSGVGYTETVTADAPAGNGLAILDPVVTGGAVDLEGFYQGTDGWLSWDHVLQDNVYYQNYSYEITSTRSINEWRDTIKATTHPAGYALFGNLEILSVVDLGLGIDALPIDKCITTTVDVPMDVVPHDSDALIHYINYSPFQEITFFDTVIGDYAEQNIEYFQNFPIADFHFQESVDEFEQMQVLYEVETA